MINYLIFFFFILIAITTSSSTFSCSSTDLPTKTSASQAVISGRIVEVVKRKYITYVYYRVENVELLKGNRSWKKELFVGRFAEDTDVENCIGPLQFSDANKIFFLASNTPTIDSLFNISAFQISSFPVEASPHHLQLVSLQQTAPSKFLCNHFICHNGGSCRYVKSQKKAMCICKQGYHGERCQLHHSFLDLRVANLSHSNSVTSVLIIIIIITLVVYFVSLLLYTVFRRCASNKKEYQMSKAQMKEENMSFLMQQSYTSVEKRNKNEEKNITRTSNRENLSIENEGAEKNEIMKRAIGNLFDDQPQNIPKHTTHEYIVNLTRTSTLHQKHPRDTPLPNNSSPHQPIPEFSIHSPTTHRSNSAPKMAKRLSTLSPHFPEPPTFIIRPKTHQNKHDQIEGRKLSLPSRTRLYASSSTPDNSISRRTMHAVKILPSQKGGWENIGMRMASAKQESIV